MTAQGDERARTVLHDWASPMQRALQTLVAVANPDHIIVGGGLGREMCKALDLLPTAKTWFESPIRPAKLGDDAGVIGAGLHVLRSAQMEENV